jgi:hypothetical protein
VPADRRASRPSVGGRIAQRLLRQQQQQHKPESGDHGAGRKRRSDGLAIGRGDEVVEFGWQAGDPAGTAGDRPSRRGGAASRRGLGIGGAFPGAATLTGDYAPQRRRATMIMASFTGAPFGGFVCGQAAGLLLPTLGWPSVFALGGIVPLAMLPILWLWLPESPRFLATKNNLSPRQAALLRKLGVAPGQTAAGIDIARGNPVKMLFGEGYALQSVLLALIFFCSLLNLFLFHELEYGPRLSAHPHRSISHAHAQCRTGSGSPDGYLGSWLISQTVNQENRVRR